MIRLAIVGMMATISAVIIACCGGGGNDVATTPAPTNNGTPAAAVEKKDEPVGDSGDAHIFAEKYVKQFLKWPDDASFPLFDQSAKYNSDYGTWTVNGKVVAKNAFGAELTHRYHTTLYLDGNTWKCIYLQIGDQIHIADASKETPVEKKKAKERAAEKAKEDAANEKKRQEMLVVSEKEAATKLAALRKTVAADETKMLVDYRPDFIALSKEHADTKSGDAAKSEAAAIGKVIFAQKFLDDGKKATATKRLAAIVNDHPKTLGAVKAREMLKELGE